MAVAVRSASSNKSGSATTLAVTKPTGTTTGDVLAAILWQDSDGTIASLTPPSGWTQAGSDITSTSTSPYGKVWTRSVDGSEGASFTFNISTGASTVGVILALTGANTATPISVAPTAGTGTGTSQSAPTIGSGATPAAGDLLVVSYAGQNGTATTWTTPSGMTEQSDQATTWLASAVDTLVLAAAGATGAKTATSSTTPVGNYRSVSFAIAQGSSTIPVSGTDSATGSETRSITATNTTSDTATGSEAGAVAISFAGSDSATGSETYLISTPVTRNEPGSGDDSTTLVANTAASDSAAGTDSPTLTAATVGVDSAVGSETGLIRVSGTDSATGSETQSSTAQVAKTDTALGSEGGFYDTAAADLNLSLWAVNRTTGDLAPLPDFQQLTVSPVRNAVGALRVVYPADGLNYALLHNNVTADCDLEVEVWLTGSRAGALRGYLTDTEIDDAAEPVIATFSGGFLELRAGEAVVFPQVAPLGNDKQELTFSAATAGTIMSTLLTQAQARGTLTDLTKDFTPTADSRGVAWPQVVTTKYSPGATYLSVLDSLVALGLCEWSITADHVLHLFLAGGRGQDRTTGPRPVILRRGRNITDAPRKHSVRTSATAVLVAGSENLYQTASDASALARRGRRVETFTSANNLTDTVSVQAYAQTELAVVAPGAMEITHGLGFLPGEPRPGTVFDVGDWVFSDTSGTLERRRVAQWTLTVGGGSDATPTGSVTLNDTTTDAVSALLRRLNAVSSGTAVVGTSTGTSDSGTPNPPTSVTASSTAFLDGNSAKASVLVGWTPPTTNTDGTSLNDLASCLVQFAYDAQPALWLFGNTANQQANAATFTASPGVGVKIRVAAVDSNGNQSAFTTPISHTTAADATAPAVTSTPVVSNYLGVLKIAWDGLTSTGAVMLAAAADFDHVDVHISGASGFTPGPSTYFDRLFAAGAVVYTDGVYGVTYYAKLVAVDSSGNASVGSAQASDAPAQVVGADVFAGAVGTVQLADAAITTAKINDLAVNNAKIGDLSVGKLTAGTLSATVLLSGLIRTATTGARSEIDAAGIRLYNTAGNLTVRLQTSDGSALVTGTYQSGLSGERINLLSDGTMQIFGSSGTDFAEIANDVGVVRFKSRADGSGRRSFANFDPTGFSCHYGPSATSAISRFDLGLTYGVINAPVTGIRIWRQTTPADGTQNRFHLLTATGSGDDAASVIHFYGRRSSISGSVTDNVGVLRGATQAVAILVGAGSIAALGNRDDVYGPFTADGFSTPSSGLLKTRPTALARTIPSGARGVLQSAPSQAWHYLHDLEPRPATPGVKVQRVFDDGSTEMVDADWAGPARKPRLHFGPIAEDLAAVSEHLAHRDDQGQLMTDLRDLVGILWGAVADLDRDHTTRLDALEGEGVDVVDGEVA